ncbi:MAG: methyltransferase [Proteobacteria bacterium]|nr:methyltransferase [Pseudomonadota bacterium]
MTLDIIIPPRPKRATTEGSLLFLESTGGRPSVNFEREATGAFSDLYAPHKVVLRDARACAPRLDTEGFALLRHRSRVRDFWDETEVGSRGRAEAAEIVAKATGAHHVHVFDHTLRRRSPDSPRQPSTRVHNDYTPASARQRVRELLGETAARQPYAFINVWRPIRHAALDWPLALCDARSVSPDDLAATDIQYENRRGEIYHVRYNRRQRWYTVPTMQLHEALLIKCADTRKGRAQFAPHTAFAHPDTPPEAPPRESVEFRTIAFFPEKRPLHIARLG